MSTAVIEPPHSMVSPDKSTNVRSKKSRGPRAEALIAPVARQTIRWLPAEAGAALSEAMFLRPWQRLKPSATPKGRRFTVPVGRERVAAWSVGEGPAVLVVHGWGGHGLQFAALTDALLDSGFRVVGFDAPAHGESTGQLASLREFSDAIGSVAEITGPPHAIVAHSLGALASLMAMTDRVQARRAALIAPLSNPWAPLGSFMEILRLEPELRRRLGDRLNRRFDRWEDIRGPELVRRLEIPFFIAHDRQDRVLGVEHARALAHSARKATLLQTVGLGHRRILSDPSVLDAVVRFVRSPLDSRKDSSC